MVQYLKLKLNLILSNIYTINKGGKYMKSTGIVRNLDELGRIVIPKEIRKKLGIEQKDPIEVFIDGNSIVLRKYEKGCIFCNNPKDLQVYKEKLICKKCLNSISELKNKN